MRYKIKHRISSWVSRGWYTPVSVPLPWLLRILLFLGTRIYAKALQFDQHRARQHRRGLPVFVISVGNLVAGGAGKTPFTLWLANHLHNLGWNPAILSRGYLRHDCGSARVPSSGASFQQVVQFGDEPVFMAHRAKPVPVWVGRERWRSGNLAIQTGRADVLILDDGFQHLSLKRDLDLVLVDADSPFGNGALLPRGPLREPPEHLARADAIILTRAEKAETSKQTRIRMTSWFPEKPVFACIHRLTRMRVGLDGQCFPLTVLRGKKAIAFAGLARPENFFHLLQLEGIIVNRSFAFPDHHQYQEPDLAMLIDAMEKSDAAFLITTEKDMVRLPAEFQAFTLAAVLEIDFLSEHQTFCNFLQERLPSHCCLA